MGRVTNTTVNGERVDRLVEGPNEDAPEVRYALRPGDVVRVGDLEAVFRDDATFMDLDSSILLIPPEEFDPTDNSVPFNSAFLAAQRNPVDYNFNGGTTTGYTNYPTGQSTPSQRERLLMTATQARTTAEEMAVQVLKGDMTAARALADYLCEHVYANGGMDVKPEPVVVPAGDVKVLVYFDRPEEVYVDSTELEDAVRNWLTDPTRQGLGLFGVRKVEIYSFPKG